MVKNILSKINVFFARFNRKVEAVTVKHPFLSCLVMGAFMNVLISILHAGSVVAGFSNLFLNLGFTIFNTLILVTFYAVALLFPRRMFVMFFTTLFWFAMGVTNCILMRMRNAPLEGIDFYIIRTGFRIVFMYMSLFEIILYSVLILLSVAVLVIFFIKCPKIRPKYVTALLILLCCLISLSLVGVAAISLDREHESNLTVERCGFPYFFLRSIFDRGIKEPDEYSKKTIEDVLIELEQDSASVPQKLPNIIFVQLESFFDINRLKGVNFSKNPIPNYTELAKKYSSGSLGVSVLGSGTANTEFEVLSGLNMDFFGIGEYPYESLLDDRCCETAAYDLKEIGYPTHAIHNHTATFYDRFEVYANLGFDTFTATEHMNGVDYNCIGWEKDEILTEYILKALDSTPAQDFVFTVSVQGHGKYPDIEMERENEITVSGAESEDEKNSIEFFANEIYETDAFIGELYNALKERGEDFVLVLYGDHLPALELTEEKLYGGGLYKTDYMIINNMGLDFSGGDVEAFQLFSTVFEKLGITGGLINKVHAAYKSSPEYYEILELVSYDVLYGDRIAYGETTPYLPTQIKLGIDEITITDTEAVEDGFIVKGENFTEFSHVFLNGRKLDTFFIDKNTLFAENATADYGDEIFVAQISADFRKLSQTPPHRFSPVLAGRAFPPSACTT